MATGDAALAFEGVSLDLPGTGRVLAGIDFAVAPGEPTAVLGPSGCGKSSMLRLAAGLAAPSAGRVSVHGEALGSPRRETALVLQDLGLLPWKTVRANVELGLRLRRVPVRERRERARAALDRVGLADAATSYPDELSGGQRQRVAIARSLALSCDLLLMDEPLSALDAIMREQIQDMLLDLWKQEGYAQVLVTHSIEEAAFLGRRIVVMAARPGRVARLVENPGMGDRSFRGTDRYRVVCAVLRRALEEAMAHA